MSWNQIKKEIMALAFTKEETTEAIQAASMQLVQIIEASIKANAVVKQTVLLEDLVQNEDLLVSSYLPDHIIIVSDAMTSDYSVDPLIIPIPSGYVLNSIIGITGVSLLSATFEYGNAVITETLEMTGKVISTVNFNSSAGYPFGGDFKIYVSGNHAPGFRVAAFCTLSPFVTAPTLVSAETMAADVIELTFSKAMKQPNYNAGDIVVFVNGISAQFVFDYDEEDATKANLTLIGDIVFGDEITITILENKLYSEENLYFAGCVEEEVVNNVEEEE